jgi:hypothetical protein
VLAIAPGLEHALAALLQVEIAFACVMSVAHIRLRQN